MSEKVRRLLMDPGDTVVLVGAVLPPDPDVPGTVVLTSSTTDMRYDDEDREQLEWLKSIHTWDEVVGHLVADGGSEQGLLGWVEKGLLARFPGLMSDEEFLKAFEGLALVPTAPLTTQQGSHGLELTFENRDGTLPIDPALYELLSTSTGMDDLPTCMRRVTNGDPEAMSRLIGECAFMLRYLQANGVTAVVHSQ